MNLKLHEMINLHYELNGITKQEPGQAPVELMQGILKQKMSLKLKVYLQRLNRILVDDIKLYEDSRQELFKKYAEENEGMLTVPPSKVNDFNKEHNDLLTAEKEVNVSTLWGADFTLDSLTDIETDETYPILFQLLDEK